MIDFRPRFNYKAKNGGQGSSRQKDGACGEDMVLEVPAGTVVMNEKGQVIADFETLTEKTLLHGGRGGKGNSFFKNSINQAPEHFQIGEEGETLKISLELKLIADVGLIGFPNAGKSTLISSVSAAKPKIADYPFTTLTPNLGVVKLEEGKSFVIADIPGLIEGAHEGTGLGHQFLRHIERTHLLVHLIDVSSMREREPVEAFELLNHELQQYDELKREKEDYLPLSQRPQIVVFNKADSLDRDECLFKQSEFRQKCGIEPLVISAVTGQGLKKLLEQIAKYVFKAEKE